MEEIAAGEGRRVPSWAKRLHMENLYRWMIEKPIHALNDSLFKKKLKETDLEKQEEVSQSAEKDKEGMENQDIENKE